MCVWYSICNLINETTQTVIVTFLDRVEYKSLNEISIVIIYYCRKTLECDLQYFKYSSSELHVYSPHSICFMLTLIFLLANELCIHVCIIQHIIISTHTYFRMFSTYMYNYDTCMYFSGIPKILEKGRQETKMHTEYVWHGKFWNQNPCSIILVHSLFIVVKFIGERTTNDTHTQSSA